MSICRRLFVFLLLVFFTCNLFAQQRDTLHIVFAGDLLLDRGVRQHIGNVGIDCLFSFPIDSLFHHSDIVIANLECPATTIVSPVNKQFIFRAEPQWLYALKHHGITHLNLANNHSFDQGREGLIDTKQNIFHAGLVPMGAGRTMKEALQPILLAEYPRKVYCLSSVVLPLENWSYLENRPNVNQQNINSLIQEIKVLKKVSPDCFIIISLHWGIEHTLEPIVEQRYDAHRLIDAGADCIIGHHPHTLQSIELYHGKYIYYSIGNFIFDQKKTINTKACLVQINLSKERYNIVTLPISIRHCTPFLVCSDSDNYLSNKL